MRELRHIEQVACNTRHQLANLCMVIIGKRQLLQMLKQIAAHICFDISTHHMPDILHVVVGRRVDDTQHQIKPPDFQHKRDSQACHIVHAAFRDKSHHQRQHQLADRRQRRAEQIKRQHPSVLFKIWSKTPQKRTCFNLPVQSSSSLHELKAVIIYYSTDNLRKLRIFST